ncbi:MAG: CBS domain-containing protein [Pseudomonadales bacterium]
MTMPTLRVRDYMQPEPVTVHQATELLRAVRMMIDRDISAMPVIDDSGRLVGILTERDCIRTVMQAGYHDESGGPVSRCMTRDVQTMSPDDSLMDAAELFADSSIHRCPVVVDDRPVGMISRRAVLGALTEQSWFTKH